MKWNQGRNRLCFVGDDDHVYTHDEMTVIVKMMYTVLERKKQIGIEIARAGCIINPISESDKNSGLAGNDSQKARFLIYYDNYKVCGLLIL